MKKKFKKYLENYEVLFSNREEDSERFLDTLNKLLKFSKKNILSSDKKILDLGSGDKSFYNLCVKKGLNIKEIDGTSGINFETDELPFNDDEFDFVIFSAVIEHLSDANLILSEINRLLKKNGILITLTPNFTYCYKYFYDDPTHIHPYTPKSLIKILEMNNFNQNYVYPFLVKKSEIFWKLPFKFFIASKIPFRNNTFQKIPIPNFFRGKSTSMISISQK